MEYAIWILVGWCGTPYPRRWPFPPPPNPDPWMAKGIGVVGGLLGGLAFTQLFDAGMVSGVIGAFVGSGILTDVVGLVQGRGK